MKEEVKNGSFRNKKIYFTQVSNNALRDKTLSLKAKGLYCIIQSFITIEGFTLYKSMLENQCKDKETSFDSAWKELKDSGYLIQYKVKDCNTGKWIYQYDLLDIPQVENPHGEKPTGGKPTGGKPTGGKPTGGKQGGYNNTYINNTYINNTNNNNTTTTTSDCSCSDFNIFKYAELRNFILSPIQVQQLQDDIKMYSLEEVKKALDIADDNGKHTYSYVKGILQKRRSGSDKKRSSEEEFEKLRQKALETGEEPF